MEITITEVGPSQKNINISISAEEIQKKYDEKVAELQAHSMLPGFRPGRVPKNVIETKYGKAILQEIKGEFLDQAYEDAKKNHKLTPIRPLSIEENKVILQKNQPCTMEILVEVIPDFALPEYKGIEVQLPKVRISNKEVDQELANIRKQRGEWFVVEDGTSQEQDLLICDINLEVNGKLIWGKQNFSIEVEDTTVMGLAIGRKLLTGKKVGDVCQKSMPLPSDFKISEYAGQAGEITLTIQEIKRAKLPEIDENLARELGFKDIPDLKGGVRNRLKEQKDAEFHQEIEAQILLHLLNNTQIEIPEALIEPRLAMINERLRKELQNEGKSEQKIEAHIEKTKEKNKADITQQIKESLIIQRISDTEQIAVSDEEMEEYIKSVATQQKKWPHEIREELEKRGLLEEVRYQLKVAKVLAFLREQAKIVEK